MSATSENNRPAAKGKRQVLPRGIEWEDEAPLTVHGHLTFLSKYLEAGGLFKRLAENCPMKFTSNNAPEVADVLGTAVLSILRGHTRYNHAQELYGDTLAAELLGIGRLVSHDSLRRAFGKMEGKEAKAWLQDEMLRCIGPLLSQPYVLDIDPTVKTLYGEQEGAELGYNPKKPGRPSHCLHTFFIGSLRLVAGCELRNLRYLFKLRQSQGVKALLDALLKSEPSWHDAGAGWQDCETELRLQGWTQNRRGIILRREAKHQKAAQRDGGHLLSGGTEEQFLPLEILPPDETPQYEWSVLCTNLTLPILSVSQLYRDRGDCENNFDELKNQWGWQGFTTQDLKRSEIMAMLIALVANWWNIFCRLAEPERHLEPKTSRPLLQSLLGRLTSHGGKRQLHLTATGSAAAKVRALYEGILAFLDSLRSTAEQLTEEARWAAILAHAFTRFLEGKRLPTVSDGTQLLLPV